MAGGWLILPARNNQNNAGVVHAATEVIDGVTYEVITLTSDSAANMSKINAHKSGDTGNYRYVMTGDWDLVTNKVAPYFYGNHLIFDFNGHSIRSTGYSGGGFLPFFQPTTTLELTCSGPSSGGTTPIVFRGTPQTVIFSGNFKCTYFEGLHAETVIIRGVQQLVTAENANYFVAPYIKYSAGAYVPSHAYYTVSASDILLGEHNYEFNLGWDLTVGELSKLAIPNDRTYYLYGRNADGAYEYLNIQSVDGAWVKTV